MEYSFILKEFGQNYQAVGNETPYSLVLCYKYVELFTKKRAKYCYLTVCNKKRNGFRQMVWDGWRLNFRHPIEHRLKSVSLFPGTGSFLSNHFEEDVPYYFKFSIEKPTK